MRFLTRMRILLVAACLASLAAGCAASGAGGSVQTEGMRAAARLDEGALALRQARFRLARESLSQARALCGDAMPGRQALLLLAALELDPRNADRDPSEAARLAAAYLRLPETWPWTRPLAEALYLLALDLGAAVPDPGSGADSPMAAGADCEAGDRYAIQAASGPLPELESVSMPDRLRTLERQRARERRTIATLESQVAELKQELDRVRRTLSP